MKKLSLLIALGSFVFLSIAKPSINVTAFESYSRQMQDLSARYIADKKFDYANKAIEKWIESYNTLSANEKGQYNDVYSAIMYQQACTYTQTNELYKALKSLKESVRTGFSNSDQALNDPNLKELSSYTEFKKIIQSISKS
ncbi:MAG: hypothetical protein IPM95_03360 [Sphingobacteriales bacterium]|jgi:hypothetical protein|nr:hypothetical protein [Sphingobacteriales bacterium]